MCLFSLSQAVCAPPFLYLPLVKSLLKEDRYSVAAQNLKAGGPGAFTGEITAESASRSAPPSPLLVSLTPRMSTQCWPTSASRG